MLNQDKCHKFSFLVKTNQGAMKVLFPNIAFSKLNNVFCEIMRASILCNLNFVGNNILTNICTYTY